MAQPNDGRQYPLLGLADIAFGDNDPATGVESDAMELPSGATVIGGSVIVDVVSDAVTSDVVDIGDADDPNRYTTSGAVDLKTLGATALDLSEFVSTDINHMISMTRVEVGGSKSQGSFRLQVQYMVADRSNENQGDVK